MASASERVYDLIKDTVKALGVELWDVTFVKEGASWYLRVFIDKENGISIDDCTTVSHAIDPILDEADPIDKSYYLEVCSCGFERELTRAAHYNAMIGEKIKVRLYKAIDGKKEFIGILKGFDGEALLDVDGVDMRLALKDISKANVYYFE